METEVLATMHLYRQQEAMMMVYYLTVPHDIQPIVSQECLAVCSSWY